MCQLYQRLEEVDDQSSLLRFVQALVADRRRQEAAPSDEVSDWANHSIADFLEGALSWAEDSDFGRSQDPTLATNPWQQFAVFLYCGKIYE